MPNASIGHVSNTGDWNVFFWTKNLFDEEYVPFAHDNPIIRVFRQNASDTGARGFP